MLPGFGTTGPKPSDGGLKSSGYAPEDMSHELGRSLPGFHAGEIARVHAYLTGRDDISSIVLAVVEDHTDSAMLHAILATAATAPASTPAKLAIVGGQASLAAAAQARLYSPDNYWSWVFGLLTVYDKPDAVAAVLSLPKAVDILVLGPLDEMLRPLSEGVAKEVYAFASSVGSGRLAVQAGGPAGALAAISKWFAGGAGA